MAKHRQAGDVQDKNHAMLAVAGKIVKNHGNGRPNQKQYAQDARARASNRDTHSTSHNVYFATRYMDCKLIN